MGDILTFFQAFTFQARNFEKFELENLDHGQGGEKLDLLPFDWNNSNPYK